MDLLPKNSNGCPFLLLAPMEGVGDRTFRRAMATVGGFNEAVTDFIRVPSNAHVKSLAKEYEASELNGTPLAPQIMGSEPALMAEMTQEMVRRGAKRVDLNCGCPSNRVTGRGAGSSLLKEPEALHEVAKAMVEAVEIPVTLKMRSGFEDTSLFRENLLAAQESGVAYITLHPRTKADGYGPPAKWELIAEAKALLKIPLVGNGDILNVEDAQNMLQMSQCDALMIGRGSLINPFIFHQIRAAFDKTDFLFDLNSLVEYISFYFAQIPSEMPGRVQVNKLKQLLSFIFKGNERLQQNRPKMLTSNTQNPLSFLEHALFLLRDSFEQAS